MKTSEQIFEVILGNLKIIDPDLCDKEINRKSKLSPLGLDSIGRAELIEMTKESLGLEIPRHELHSASNLGELADCFVNQLKFRGRE